MIHTLHGWPRKCINYFIGSVKTLALAHVLTLLVNDLNALILLGPMRMGPFNHTLVRLNGSIVHAFSTNREL